MAFQTWASPSNYPRHRAYVVFGQPPSEIPGPSNGGTDGTEAPLDSPAGWPTMAARFSGRESSMASGNISTPGSSPGQGPLTFQGWLILGTAAMGFAFDIYVLLILPLI